MQYELPQVISRVFFAILMMSLVNAKPPHYQENTQGLSADQVRRRLCSNCQGRPWQLELFAQRMAELNQLSQMNNNLNGQEYGTFDRALRSGNEIKRQSRYRLCYFNPVSCFKK
nr:allatostatin [Dendroctonus armandi]